MDLDKNWIDFNPQPNKTNMTPQKHENLRKRSKTKI